MVRVEATGYTRIQCLRWRISLVARHGLAMTLNGWICYRIGDGMPLRSVANGTMWADVSLPAFAVRMFWNSSRRPIALHWSKFTC